MLLKPLVANYARGKIELQGQYVDTALSHLFGCEAKTLQESVPIICSLVNDETVLNTKQIKLFLTEA